MHRIARAILGAVIWLAASAIHALLSYVSFSNGALDLVGSDNGHRMLTSLLPLQLGQPWYVRKLLIICAEPLRSLVYNEDGVRFAWVGKVLLSTPNTFESWERLFRVCALLNTLLCVVLVFMGLRAVGFLWSYRQAQRRGIAA